MNEVAIWSLEEQFWMEAEIYYRSALDPECIMGFPAPVGIIVGKAILESLAQAPRWAAIEMGDCGLVRPTPDLIALGYRARATRRGAEPYQAFCTSCYRASVGGWKLFQHHQSPDRLRSRVGLSPIDARLGLECARGDKGALE